MASRKARRGIWIGLAALALQIMLSPVLSGWALAMELDPLADAKICSATLGAPNKLAPMPMKHAGHCAECCLVHCAAEVAPGLAPAAFDFVLPPAADALSAAVYLRPLTRGPPPRALPATGPPSTLA